MTASPARSSSTTNIHLFTPLSSLSHLIHPPSVTSEAESNVISAMPSDAWYPMNASMRPMPPEVASMTALGTSRMT